MHSSEESPPRIIRNADVTEGEQVPPAPCNPAQLPVFPLQAVGRATGHQGAPVIDAGVFVNFSEFNRDITNPVTTAGNIDWEHANRIPTGSSILDTNSVTDESGRSFHGYKQGKYFLPNDAAEQDRLDLQHAAFMHLLDGRLGLAPVEHPNFVLDVATGTGIWAMEFAKRYPEAQVIGSDLSAIQPKWQLPNCSFIQDDAEEEWLFGSSEEPIQFDYVHLRMVFTCFDRPRDVIRHAYKNLKPGGWIEYLDGVFDMQSIDNNIQGTALQLWHEGIIKGMSMKGRDLSVTNRYGSWLHEQGFVNVMEQKFLVPCNPWPQDPKLKKIGQFMMTNYYEGFRGVGWKAFKFLGYTAPEIEQMVTNAKQDITNAKYRVYIPISVIYGQKPFD